MAWAAVRNLLLFGMLQCWKLFYMSAKCEVEMAVIGGCHVLLQDFKCSR